MSRPSTRSQPTQLYCIEVELGRRADDPLPDDCGGAFVNVYVAEPPIRWAIDLAENQLLADGYHILDILAALSIDLAEYEPGDADDGQPSTQALADLSHNGEVLYSTFHLYPPQEAQLH